jgi:hypothetical protein
VKYSLAVKWKEVLSRLTGVSTPIGGISWQPSEPESEAARRMIAFLEDRRVLYSMPDHEHPMDCIHSALEIRRFLTEEIGKLGDNELAQSLRAMRAACREFLNEAGDRSTVHAAWRPDDLRHWKFYGALGKMRGLFGVQLALISAKFKLDIEDDLATILPPAPSKNDDKDDMRFIG